MNTYISDSISNRQSECDQRYFPTVQDLRNNNKQVINKIQNNMFHKDTLQNFLNQEGEQNEGFMYFSMKQLKKTTNKITSHISKT